MNPTRVSLPTDLSMALAAARDALDGFASTVHYYAVAGSTNDIAADLARTGAADGTVVVADAQTAGRGRNGRSWFSPPGAGLYVSIILRPTAAGSGRDWRSAVGETDHAGGRCRTRHRSPHGNRTAGGREVAERHRRG